MRRKIFKAILFIIFFINIYGVNNYEKFEESYVEIRCGQLKDGFFPIKFDTENEEVYVGLKSLFYFLELYDVEVNLNNLTVMYNVLGENKKIKLKPEECFEADDELYVSTDILKSKFKFKNISFDYTMLGLRLVPEFILPYEEREKGKVERLRLRAKKELEKKKDFIKMPRRFITPGFIKIFYNAFDLQKKGNVAYEFGNQFLYGSLYLQGDFTKENLVENGSLTYNDIFYNNDLTLGNIYLDVPNFINTSNDIIGFSLNNNRTYFLKEGTFTIIKGEAEGAETIELYSGSFLLDYIHPNSKNFEFKISDGNMSEYYILKIYYSNGAIEERKVFSINDLNILEKGKNKINLQLGKGSKNGYIQSNFNLLHGITDNLTFGIGERNLTSVRGKKYNFIENHVLLNTRHKIFPTVIEFKNFYELNKIENSYNLNITQKYKEWQLKLTQERYSKYIYLESDVKDYNSVSLGKSFKDNYFEIGYEQRKVYKFGNGKVKNMYAYWSTYKLSPVYFSLKFQKYLENYYDKYSIYPTISYYGYFSTVLEAGFVKEENKNWDSFYNLKIRKRDAEILKKKLYGDIGIFFKYYGNKNSYVCGFDFNIKLDSFMYTRITSSVEKGKDKKSKLENSIEINKLIAIKNPLLKLDNSSSVTNSIIYGKVFLDKNSNGVYDDYDIPLPNAVVVVDGNKFETNENGEYMASGISSPKTIELEIDRKSIDPMTKSIFKKLKIKTESSGQLQIDIPVDMISIISGNIYNGLKIPDNKFSRKLALVNIQLIKDDLVVAEVKPEFDGMYFFEDVFPGEYKIRFNYLGQEKIKFTTEEINIKVNTSEEENGGYFEGYDTELINNEVK